MTVCALQAAIFAFNAPTVHLQPGPTSYDALRSKLLAQFAQGLASLTLTQYLLHTDGAYDFLDNALPGVLFVRECHRGSPVHHWPLRDLRWQGRALPHSLPAQLVRLELRLEALQLHSLRSLLEDISRLQHLVQLDLSTKDFGLATLDATRQSTASLQSVLPLLTGSTHSTATLNVAPLQAFAGPVKLRLNIDHISDSSTLYHDLQGVRCLQSLALQNVRSHTLQQQAALSSVSCNLCEVIWDFAGALPAPVCNTLRVADTALSLFRERDVKLQWADLQAALLNGVVALFLTRAKSLEVRGCTGALPRSGCALLLQHPQNFRINGLPLHLFQTGPHGGRVWRAGDMSDNQLAGMSLWRDVSA